MKKSLAIIICLTLLFGAGCQEYSSPTSSGTTTNYTEGDTDMNSKKEQYTLIVNGEIVEHKYNVGLNRDKSYAELPMITVLEHLGVTVKWRNDNEALIVFKDRSFNLNLRDHSVIENGKHYNIIITPPGTFHTGYYAVAGHELIIDSDSVRTFISNVGAYINEDFDKSVVYIDSK